MRGFLKGFVYAARGVWGALLKERNLRFHLCAAFYVVWLSAYYDFSTAGYAILAVVICGVLALELLNTALERMVDLACPQQDERAGFIKDVAAGAVLVFCMGAVAVGFCLFWDTARIAHIWRHFIARPWLVALFLATAALWGWFIFGPGHGKSNAQNNKEH